MIKKEGKKQNGEVLMVTTLTLAMLMGFVATKNLNLGKGHLLGLSFSGDKGKETIEQVSIEEIALPTFASKQEILDKIGKNTDGMKEYLQWNGMAPTADFIASTDSSSSLNESMRDDSSSKMEYSVTNTQVQGVDEGDIVKTNGDYIYYLSQGNLYIFETKTTQTKLVKTIKILDRYYYYGAQEMYIDDNYITVITQETANRKEVLDIEQEQSIEKQRYAISPMTTQVTAMYVYDIDTYELVKNVKTEGEYVSSRKVNQNIYLVTNKYLYSYYINEDNILPIYSECNAKTLEAEDNYKEIPANEIKYFSDCDFENNCNYMIITAINLKDIDSKAGIDTYLGAGTEIYCSRENLYVTRVNYKNNYWGSFLKVVEDISEDEENVTTQIHKFKLLDGAVKYVATGEVPGSLLNQYSMDENKEYFRITTTSDSGNNLYILNNKLEKVGELRNLAQGEKIYATRFMGDKCYLVTYKTVDPLFVIDLSNPQNPVVLGELKIPGYSTYLHPLGENFLIGFGEDSVEKSYLNWKGETQVTAYNTGLKLAIFDISDLANPKEIYSVKVGGRGSSSELLYNPRVLYYDEENEIFAFPATLTEETKFYQDGTPMYGKTIFEGALVYNLSVENGITLRGKIEHTNVENNSKNNSNEMTRIERILRIKDNFYTLSSGMLKVTNIENMKEIEEGTCQWNTENKFPQYILID